MEWDTDEDRTPPPNCCCKKRWIGPPDTALVINDTCHELPGPSNFCGPPWKHLLRDAEKEIAKLTATIETMGTELKLATEDPCGGLVPVVRRPCLMHAGQHTVEECLLLSQIETLKRERHAEDEAWVKGAPHNDPKDCPLWYDYCLCTVGTLAFNMDRADALEECQSDKPVEDCTCNRCLKVWKQNHLALIDRYQKQIADAEASRDRWQDWYTNKSNEKCEAIEAGWVVEAELKKQARLDKARIEAAGSLIGDLKQEQVELLKTIKGLIDSASDPEDAGPYTVGADALDAMKAHYAKLTKL